MADITTDLILSTRPCANWPRARVEAALARLDTSSWTALATSAQAGGWSVVTCADLLLTVCRYAAAHHRATVLLPWVQHVTHVRVAAQRRWYPGAPAEVVALWDRLDAWDGTAASAREICDDAWRARTTAATYAAAYAAYAVAAAIYAYAADADAAAAAASAAAVDVAAEALLLDLCARLDEVPRG